MTAEAPIDVNAILDIIADEGMVDRAPLTVETRLEDLGIESLEMVNVLFAIEDKFGVIVEPETLQSAQTIGDMIAVIQATPPTPAQA
jgi:acyl carrier protein